MAYGHYYESCANNVWYPMPKEHQFFNWVTYAMNESINRIDYWHRHVRSFYNDTTRKTGYLPCNCIRWWIAKESHRTLARLVYIPYSNNLHHDRMNRFSNFHGLVVASHEVLAQYWSLSEENCASYISKERTDASESFRHYSRSNSDSYIGVYSPT
jgi:hypothetical protein